MTGLTMEDARRYKHLSRRRRDGSSAACNLRPPILEVVGFIFLACSAVCHTGGPT